MRDDGFVSERMHIADALRGARTESGRVLLELAEESPVLLVFLRHFGCAFCRQAISDVSDVRERLTRLGVRPVFVHMGPPAIALRTFAHYGMEDVERVCDPAAELYKVFGLGKRSAYRQPFEWSVLKAWFIDGALWKHGIGKVHGDGDQMHGVFFLRGAEVVRKFVHKSFADRPDYLRLVR
jgi:peroxiredoxin